MAHSESHLQTTIRLWTQGRPTYNEPHFASAETTLSPQQVDVEHVGHFMSGVFERGTRVYMFEGQKNRDRFVNKYRQWGARPCKDPLP